MKLIQQPSSVLKGASEGNIGRQFNWAIVLSSGEKQRRPFSKMIIPLEFEKFWILSLTQWGIQTEFINC